MLWVESQADFCFIKVTALKGHYFLAIILILLFSILTVQGGVTYGVIVAMNIQFFFRLVGMVVFGILGWQLGSVLAQSPEQRQYVYLLMLAGAALGATAAPYFTTVPFNYARKWVKMLPAIDLIASSIGLTLGLLVAGLLTFPLSQLPDLLGKITPVIGAIVLGYFGVAIMVMRKREVFEFFGLNRAAGSLPKDSQTTPNGFARSILVDTSAIIDGRIADVSQTGFIEGTLIIPRFVLNELQHIADSSDQQRRNRGQRGLEMLRKLRKDSVVPIEITEIDAPDVNEVDGKLVKLAKTNHYPIITNDYNLNRVAELQGVKVLNVNELAQAVRPVVLPGEELVVRVTQEGKEMGQGLSYLDDGTMIVIENGRRYMNQEVTLNVTRVLQTVAGRMIFAQVRNNND